MKEPRNIALPWFESTSPAMAWLVVERSRGAWESAYFFELGRCYVAAAISCRCEPTRESMSTLRRANDESPQAWQ